LFELPPTSRARSEAKRRARPQAQRKGKRSQKVAKKVGGGERFDLIIVGESKSEQVGSCQGYYCRLMSERMVFVVECAVT